MRPANINAWLVLIPLVPSPAVLWDMRKRQQNLSLMRRISKEIDPKTLMQYSKDAKLGTGELASGDVLETIPKYVSENSGFRISLLNLDLDTYHGTKVALEHFFPLVTPGEMMFLDEYGMRGWGESDAVDEYFSGIGEKIKINACRDSTKPTAFIQKPL